MAPRFLVDIRERTDPGTAVCRWQTLSHVAHRGDLPEHVAEAFEAQKQAVEALQRPTAALAEQLDAQLPALPESDAQRTSDRGISIIVPKACLGCLLWQGFFKKGMSELQQLPLGLIDAASSTSPLKQSAYLQARFLTWEIT